MRRRARSGARTATGLSCDRAKWRVPLLHSMTMQSHICAVRSQQDIEKQQRQQQQQQQQQAAAVEQQPADQQETPSDLRTQVLCCEACCAAIVNVPRGQPGSYHPAAPKALQFRTVLLQHAVQLLRSSRRCSGQRPRRRTQRCRGRRPATKEPVAGSGGPTTMQALARCSAAVAI